jgi:hypothetical protein
MARPSTGAISVQLHEAVFFGDFEQRIAVSLGLVAVFTEKGPPCLSPRSSVEQCNRPTGGSTSRSSGSDFDIFATILNRCLPEARPARQKPISLATATANYRAVLNNPRAWVCFSVVFVEGAVIYGWLPFLGDFLRTLNLGGVREAGIVISGLAIGGILYTAIVPLLLRVINRRQMMAAGGSFAAAGLFCLSFGAVWPAQWAFMGATGFGFFLLHNPIQTEVSELSPNARASAFSLHSFFFYVGQALGPILYASGAHSIGLQTSLLVGQPASCSLASAHGGCLVCVCDATERVSPRRFVSQLRIRERQRSPMPAIKSCLPRDRNRPFLRSMVYQSTLVMVTPRARDAHRPVVAISCGG